MHRIGVCSWSLKPSGPAELVDKVRACGVRAIQLELDPIRRGEWDERATADGHGAAGVTVLSGMMRTAGEDYSSLETIRHTGGIRPDRLWPDNLRAARENALVARRLHIPLVTLHAGFLPHEPGDPLRRTMLDRLRQIADIFASQDIDLALETGQESADTLLEVLHELAHPRVGVNFDPGNMILYGMGEPLGALRRLAAHVKQIHIKDAIVAKTAGAWGEETPVGNGAIDWSEFFRLVDESMPTVDLVIEREAGEARIEDVRRAHDLARRLTRLKD